MAHRVSPFLSLLLISNVLLLTVAGRNHIAKNSHTQDKKEPEFLFKHDGRVYIPGIGPVGFPPKHEHIPQNPFTGRTGGAGTGAGAGAGAGAGSGAGSPPGRSYVPGGDDTFVPNPGYEVPIPGGGGSVPAPIHP